MPYANDGNVGDIEKLQLAINDILTKFGSIDNILDAFGLSDMPLAQRYGILFGCIVFTLTVFAVLTLLILGGSFTRIAQQAETGSTTILSAIEVRKQRALLLEQLLEGRERMIKEKYQEPQRSDKPTKLTKMLLNVAPDSPLDDDNDNEPELNTDITDENNNTVNITNNKQNGNNTKKKERYVPPYYEENYIAAYRKCQDKPGGAILSGRPEARYEAYARGYAGCGPYTNLSYRRSYGRMYEAICCVNHTSDDKYTKLYKERPHDIIGKYVRLEALEVNRHLNKIYQITSGEPALDNKAYDPYEIWGFLEDGPFNDVNEMHKSFVFQRKYNEAGFAIVNSITEKVMGVILLTNDDPYNLSIQLEVPIMQPVHDGSKEQLETCYLLIDRIFAYGYRRIQISIDSQDAERRKLCTRLGFTLEGILYKHMIIKDANRDSNICGLLNSDWKKGARSALFKKLYGTTALKADRANEHAEDEYDEQQRVLKEQQQKDNDKQKEDISINNKKNA